MPGGPPGGGDSRCRESEEFAGLPANFASARLPAGRHGLPRSFVAQNQRARIVAAMIRLLPEHGYRSLAIGQITGRANVSRAAFYAQFSSKEECFLTTYDLASGWLCDGITDAARGMDEWQERVRAGVAEALRLLAANPLVAHLLTVEVYRVGAAAWDRKQAMLNRFAEALRDGHPGRPDLPDDMADLLLGGVVSLIGRHVAAGEVERLPESTEALVDFILLPYLGGEEPGATLA